ncbi:MAG TPA: DNA-binding domain-containing protein [Candidatus Polarisedimenticolia bacterium]|nr:DNA-binding domain-containing protein [Candidatus Polarisedimenticolia bacterium]
MSRAAGLLPTQRLFWDLIAAPEGVLPGLEALVREGRAGTDDLDRMIVGDARLSASDRLDIYANMYFFRLLDALKEDYPRLLAALGAARFHNLITDYLLACPSRHPSLRYLGDRLPEFLARHPLERESAGLADLARLEWARADIFDAADAPVLTRADLAKLPPDDAGDLRVALVPAYRLLRLGHDAVSVWRALGSDSGTEAAHAGNSNAARMEADGPTCAHHDADHLDPIPRFGDRPTAVRVWRQGFAVHHRSMDDEERDALLLLAEGATLGRVAQCLSAGLPVAEATARFGALLQRWLDDGLLTRPVAA